MKIEKRWQDSLSAFSPAHDVGQLFTVTIYLLLVFTIFHKNFDFLIHIVEFSFFGIFVANISLGLCAAYSVMPLENYEAVRKILMDEKKIVEIKNNCWAPKNYKSWLWNSSWLIIKLGRSEFKLVGRHRDLQIIQYKLRALGNSE
jgi:hypothetical protein